MSEYYFHKFGSVRLHNVYDYVVVISIGVACIPYLIGIFVIIYNRDYIPIKIRGVTLTVVSAVGGLIWVFATITVNNHFGRKKSTFWTICSLWTFWLQGCFGFALWLNCMTIHLGQLYYLLILKRTLKKQHSFIWAVTSLLVLLSPVIIACIFASVYHVSRFEAFQPPSAKHHPEGDCIIHGRTFVAILLVLLPTYFLLFLFFAFKLRRFMAQHNSFREIRNGGVMCLFVFLLSLVTLQTRTYTQPVGRCFLSLSVALVVFYYFWARNGEIIYNVLFHKATYLERFREEFQQSSADSRRNHPDQSMGMQALLCEKKREATVYSREVKELEENIKNLKQSCEEMEKRLRVSKSLSFEISPTHVEHLHSSRREPCSR